MDQYQFTADEIRAQEVERRARLRDEFAMAALTGVMSGRTSVDILDEKRPIVFMAIASLCYELADAAMKVREK